MKKVYKIALHGCNRNENFGDVLLMQIFKEWLEGYGYEVLFDRSTEYFAATLGVEILSLEEVSKKADALVYGGGGYFGEPNSPAFKWYIKFFRDHLLPGLLFKMKGKKYVISGIGFGPISNKFFRKLAVFVVNNAAYVSVRDDVSKRYLLEYGARKDVHVCPDAALSIYNSNRVNDIRSKFVCFHLALDSQISTESDLFLSLLKLVSDICSLFHDKGECCFLIDHGIKIPPSSIYHQLNSRLANPLNIIPYSNPETTLLELSKFEYVITTKLHVAITSYAMGVTPLSIAKHQKTIRFFEQIGLKDFHTPIDDFNNEGIEKLIGIISSNKKIIVSSDLVSGSLLNKKNILNELKK